MTRPLEPDEPDEPTVRPDERRRDEPEEALEDAPAEAPEAWRPRPFVLARPLEPGDEDEVVYPDDVVTWGLAFADHAMTYFRDPVTHHCDQGRFDSADRARRRYSQGGSTLVRLVWLR